MRGNSAPVTNGMRFGRPRRSGWALAATLVIATVGCSHPAAQQPQPQPQQPPSSAPTKAPGVSFIEFPFHPTELAYSSGSAKLYVFQTFPSWGTIYAVSTYSPAAKPVQLDESIVHGGVHHIAVNNALKRGYALLASGDLRVFDTDTDTLISTTPRRSCTAEVLAVDEATGLVYGGGLSPTGQCLVQFDSAGQLVREHDVAPLVRTENRLIQFIAADPVRGGAVYTDPHHVARADQSLSETWRTPVGGPSEANDLGFEPKTNTVYVSAGGPPVVAPATISVYDGANGAPVTQFTGPGSAQDMLPDGAGRLFALFFNSTDIYELPGRASALKTFTSLGQVSGWSPSDAQWLAIDQSGHRLFVSPGGNDRRVYVYAYTTGPH